MKDAFLWLTSFEKVVLILLSSKAVFLNCRAAVQYRALASIIPGYERFSWKLSF
jgi:hypothetical protein